MSKPQGLPVAYQLLDLIKCLDDSLEYYSTELIVDGKRPLIGLAPSSEFGVMYNPNLFAKANYLSRRDHGDLSEEFSEELGEMSGRCLDIGSGPADLLFDIILPKLNPGANILCTDVSEPMVKFGREKYGDNGRLSFAKLDIESPDLPKDLSERFDHVTSFYCIHWCQDMRQVFGNIFNLLRPGGTALVTFLANYPSSNAYLTMAAMPRYQPYMKDADRHIPVFQNDERRRCVLKALLKDIGFEVEHCSVRERSWTFGRPDDMRDFLVSQNPFIERIPDDMKKPFEDDLVKETIKQNIMFKKHHGLTGDEYSVFLRYHTFIVYFKKPL